MTDEEKSKILAREAIFKLCIKDSEAKRKKLESFVKLCRDGFFVEDKQLRDAADRILKE
jgi:hypothetical protein